MAQFALHSPTVAGSTTDWTPSRQPQLPIVQPEDSAILTTRLTDSKVVHSEQIGRYHRMFPWSFAYLTASDRANLQAFIAAVLGAAFEFVEPISGSSIPVKFESTRLEWRRDHRAALWAVSFTLLEVD